MGDGLSDAIVFLAREDAFVAVAKQSGDLVIPDRLRKEGATLFDRVRDQIGGLLLVHRLDRETSGVLLFARTIDAQRELSAAFEGGTIAKEYVALVDGVPAEDSGRIVKKLAKGRKGRIVVRDDGKDAATKWSVKQRFAAHAWLDVRPETGRTHQIRVHLAAIGLPIVGDRKYNFSNVAPVAPRLALHAAAISFTLGGKARRIEAPLPEDLATLPNFPLPLGGE